MSDTLGVSAVEYAKPTSLLSESPSLSTARRISILEGLALGFSPIFAGFQFHSPAQSIASLEHIRRQNMSQCILTASQLVLSSENTGPVGMRRGEVSCQRLGVLEVPGLSRATSGQLGSYSSQPLP